MATLFAELMTFVSSFPLMPAQSSVVIAVLVCLTLLIACIGIATAFNSRKAQQDLRQKVEGTWESKTSTERAEGPPSAKQRFLAALKNLGSMNRPRSDEELASVQGALVQAGYRSADAPFIFFGFKLGLAVLLPVAFAVLRPPALQTLSSSVTMFLFVLIALIGFYLPHVWIRMKIRYRSRKVFEGFPDSLDLLVVCVEAGLGLDAAIRRVGEEMKFTNRIVSEEFKLLDLGLRAGQARQAALKNLTRRVKVEEVNNFVALLVQTEQFGTSIAQALRVHADSMRTKRRLFAEEKAAKLPVKMLFPLIFFIFPSLFLVILGPGIMRLVKVLTEIVERSAVN